MALRDTYRFSRWGWVRVNALSGGLIGGYAGALIGTGPVGIIVLGAVGITVSVTDLIPAINQINTSGLTWCTTTRVMIDVAGIVFGTTGMVSGVRAWHASGSLFSWAPRYPAVPLPTNRQGLRIAMGTPPENFSNPQAHHNLPWTFRDWFAGEGRGPNVNDPTFGRWVEGTPQGSHQNWSYLYEREWATFISDNPNATRSQVLVFMDRLLSSGRFASR